MSKGAQLLLSRSHTFQLQYFRVASPASGSPFSAKYTTMAKIEARSMRLQEQEVPVSQVLALYKHSYSHLEAKAIQELEVGSFFAQDRQQ